MHRNIPLGGVIFLCFLFQGAFAQVTATLGRSASPARSITARDLAGITRPFAATISPDGKWVIYASQRQVLEQNTKVNEFWLTDTVGSSTPTLLTKAMSTAFSWSPDSRGIVYVPSKADELRFLRVADLTETILAKRTDWKEQFDGLEVGALSSPEWSPDGKSIAFLVSTKEKKAEKKNLQREDWQAVEMDVEAPPPSVGERTANLLCILDVQTGNVRRLTDRSLWIRGWGGPLVSWSPDATRLVISAAEIDTPSRPNHTETNLYLVDKASATVNVLVKIKDAECMNPIWSPNGKLITFKFERDVWNPSHHARIALISPSGGEMKLLADNREDLFDMVPGYWSPDSQSIYFDTNYRMSNQLFRVTLNGEITKVTPDGGYYESPSPSTDRKTMAFIWSNVNEPPEVYVASMIFSERRKLTDLNPNIRDVSVPTVELLEWRSEDRKFAIHGILVKPPNYIAGRRYPLIVNITGGPSMVKQRFGISPQAAVLEYASRGYLVLTPNTRGRGGYGRAFARAFVADKGEFVNSLGDVTSGVDELVKRGMADPASIGWVGWSYGANLGLYALTRTNRFRAAWIGEPTRAEDLFGWMNYAAVRFYSERVHKAWGFDMPISREDVERGVAAAPAFRMYNVKTPTMLECGGKAQAKNGPLAPCNLFLQGLRSYKIPVELYVFQNEDHGWTKPRQWEESYNRQMEWMDYWVRGIATDRMAKRYGPPKNPEMKARAAKSPAN